MSVVSRYGPFLATRATSGKQSEKPRCPTILPKKKNVLDQVAPFIFIGSSLPYPREVPNSNGVGTAEHLVGFPPACWRPILFARGRTRLRSCCLVAMLLMMTTIMVQMTTDGSEQTNPFDYLTTYCQFWANNAMRIHAFYQVEGSLSTR
jgi:hypothetical protein